MKGQRWKHIVLEGRGEEGVTTSEKMKAIYRGGRLKKKVWKPLIQSKNV